MSYRFALLGCGNIAERHAVQITRTGILCGVADCIPEKANALAGRFATQAFSSLDQLLKKTNPDIVVICTPNGLHASHTITALNAGCHVLCEKPLAIDLMSGLKMVETARKNEKRLFLVKQNRYNPPVAYLKSLLQQEALGKILEFQVFCAWQRPASYYHNSWKGTADLDGGTLFTQFSHFIDLIYWLLGNVSTVSGSRANLLHQNSIEFEDCGQISLNMKSGARGALYYTVNAYNSNMEGSITIFGEKGTVKIGGPYLNKLDYFNVEGIPEPQLPAGLPPNQYAGYSGSMSNHPLVYDNLLKSLDNPDFPALEGEEGLKTIEIIQKIYSACPIL